VVFKKTKSSDKILMST